MNRLCAVVSLVGVVASCNGSNEPRSSSPVQPEAVPVTPALSVPRPFLILTQAQFTWQKNAEGKRRPSPGPAKLVLLYPEGSRWRHEIIEDPDSRVFHKAVCRSTRSGSVELFTIGGTQAHLKTWQWRDNEWASTSHWNPTFGGKWDRLRDFETGDVDQDGHEEFVIATHDQGVIGVAQESTAGLTVQEVFRQPDTFIHEIEIGDTNADGQQEFYATPSDPNRRGRSQAGGILMFHHTENGKYEKTWIAKFKDRHAKEILVADIDADGRDELYVSVEAETRKAGTQTRVIKPLEIRRYDRDTKGEWHHRIIATLERGVQARVLLATKLQSSARTSLVVTTFRDGIWLLTPKTQTMAWTKLQIDASSSGFEHAAGVADLDKDGQQELYVAADDQDAVRRYTWNGRDFSRETVYTLAKSDLTWSVEACP